ncbi:hypothetical protein SZ00_00002 [Rhodococcus sp. AD45]|nr:hypothetical protein SZ00_00002 [Rhodococcus sp. AD45]
MTAPRRRSCGSTISTTNNAIIGRETRKFDVQLQLVGKYANTYVPARPRTTAPTNVRGILRSRPNIAAANASITNSVNMFASRVPPLIGVIKIPANTANVDPIAHDNAAKRSGLWPFRRNKSGSSTTPRIATPARVLVNRIRRPTAIPIATRMQINSW